MGKNLTKQEQGFVKDLIKTGNATEAVLNNFDIEDPNYAHVKGHRLIRKDTVQNAIRTLADRIPNELLEEKHLALLNKIDKEGDIDVQAVSKGLDMAYRIKGAYEEDSRKTPIIMPVLVQFLNKHESTDETNDNRDTD
jgi:phage terminase small subunit